MSEDEVGPLLTSEEIEDAQENDLLSQNLKKILRKEGAIVVDEDRLLCRGAPTDEVVQIVAPEYYRKSLLYRCPWPALAGHLETGRMYNVLRKVFH